MLCNVIAAPAATNVLKKHYASFHKQVFQQETDAQCLSLCMLIKIKLL